MKRIVFSIGIISAIAAAFLVYNYFRVVTPVWDPSVSQVVWTARSISGGHFGTVKVQDAALEFQHGTLTGGRVILDMRSIAVGDIEDKQGQEDFLRHISEKDFFEVDMFPNAWFTIREVNVLSDSSYRVTGDMTIKSTTLPETIDVSIHQQGARRVATAAFGVDRTRYGVMYGAQGKVGSTKDWFIENNIVLQVNIVLE